MLPLIINPSRLEINTTLQKLTDKYNIADHDIYKIKPLKEEITISQIRELKKDLLVSQTTNRMIVFFDFDKSGIETQNSLLKILEEKVAQNLFVFLVKNPEKIIPTIKSRAKIIRSFNKKIEKVDPFIEQFIHMIKKAKSLSFLNKKELLNITKESFLEQSNKLVVYFEKELRTNDQDLLISTKIIKKILSLTYLVESNNLNPQLAFDNLLIFIWKNYSMKV